MGNHPSSTSGSSHQSTTSSQSSTRRAAHSLSSSSNANASPARHDYPLTPSSSLTPSVTRVEAHHHAHRHGSSLDSYLNDDAAKPSTSTSVSSSMGNASSNEKLPKPRSAANRERTESSPRSIAVPTRQRSTRQGQPETPPFRPSGPPRDNDASSYAPPQPGYHHPPRLPLPIEQEELTPGSPVLTARDFRDVVQDIEGEEELDGLTPNKSLLSHTTADDEEESVGDPTEHETGPDARRRMVPVEVTWPDPGEKVYVTGTFANWSKKFRMHRDAKTGHAKTTLELLPGMHHIRYIVDGEMRLREDNDQAVDYTNTLVNIIEVPAEPVYQPVQGDQSGQTGDDEATQPADVPQPKVSDVHDFDRPEESAKAASVHSSTQSAEPELMDLPPRHYGQQVPSYLLDLDRDERSARFQRASSRVADIQPPPSLPGFLSKSILNGTTPMKDDSSVLNMPNHTVLNHLATSSIRQGVLATSLTTRYKRKYVTLITYRPTSLDD